MPPKSKPESQQPTAKTDLDDTAQQPNGGAQVSSDPAPGATDTGGGQPLAPALAPVTGASSADTPGPSTVEYPELLRYKVTGASSIQHDGSWYEAGDDIYLSDRDACGLLDGRFIVPTEEF